jgi:hypothetical protein
MPYAIALAPTAPYAVQRFVTLVIELYLGDVHAMLRLPRPEVGVEIREGCNFAICAVLMNTVSGVSVSMYDPPPDRQRTGEKFHGTLRDFYPWDAEPPGAFADPTQGARALYDLFRNPMAHGLGYQDPDPARPMFVTRLGPIGHAENDLTVIETSTVARPPMLRDVPTLRTTPAAHLELNVEAFYWGVRTLVSRLSADAGRMAAADAFLQPLLRQAAP